MVISDAPTPPRGAGPTPGGDRPRAGVWGRGWGHGWGRGWGRRGLAGALAALALVVAALVVGPASAATSSRSSRASTTDASLTGAASPGTLAKKSSASKSSASKSSASKSSASKSSASKSSASKSSAAKSEPASSTASTNTADEADPPAPVVHVVAAGETLGKIARNRGCSVAELQRRNGLGASTVILRGQRLDVTCGASTPASNGPVPKDSKHEVSPEARHRVTKGESLARIAAHYGCSPGDLRARNGIQGNTIHPGMELWIPANATRRAGVSAPIVKGQSVGKPHRGKLARGSQLPTDRAYYIRRKSRAWGADHVIHYTQAAIAAVRRLYPKIHRLAIGDLSHEAGGALSGHRSHQSGRDVDLGLFYRARPSTYPKEFAPGSARNLHVAATWALVEAILATQKLPGGVEHIFLDYELQGLLYKYAREHGVARATLGDLFQYPHGRNKGGTLIQHVPAHHDHLHVRFRCPPSDSKCE